MSAEVELALPNLTVPDKCALDEVKGSRACWLAAGMHAFCASGVGWIMVESSVFPFSPSSPQTNVNSDHSGLEWYQGSLLQHAACFVALYHTGPQHFCPLDWATDWHILEGGMREIVSALCDGTMIKDRGQNAAPHPHCSCRVPDMLIDRHAGPRQPYWDSSDSVKGLMQYLPLNSGCYMLNAMAQLAGIWNIAVKITTGLHLS